ncbi:mercury resistance system transport protein MerF [Virgibacillus sp. DJP39]|uniref:mercury resistance system transport protein MerF n=1 Tax=Virgibacillus sp. DJP39 TaxID=3409790 RepID=UPI003BB6D94D
MNNKYGRIGLVVGVIGTFITMVCCATPILIIVLSSIGIGSAVTGYLDYVLVTMIIFFLGLTYFSYEKISKKSGGFNDE